jgi:6-phosphofructokinase 1
VKRLGIITSGGDAPGMNAAVRAITRQGTALGLEVWGVRSGLRGLMEDDLIPLGPREVGDILQRGGTLLGTARADEFKTPAGQKRALDALKRYEIDCLVVIGGDGSLRAAQVLHDFGVPTVAIPATIDNDIAGTEMSIGVDTALNTIIDAINKLRDTAASHQRTFVIETMGRDCGYLALMAGVAGGAEAILIPEVPFNLKRVARQALLSHQAGKKHSFIVASEGIRGQFKLRTFQSVGEYIGAYIAKETGLEVRVTVLGHVQRGGSPTAFDRLLATRMGAAAVASLHVGESGMMMALRRGEIVAVPLREGLETPRRLDQGLLELARILAG